LAEVRTQLQKILSDLSEEKDGHLYNFRRAAADEWREFMTEEQFNSVRQAALVR
jgi:hypothetical protein